MTETLEQIGTTGSPDGPGRADAPSAREPWALAPSGRRQAAAARRVTDVPARTPEAGARAGSPAAGQDATMRILLWHGYLLGGTGSNVYTRMLAREWSSAGHDVTVLSPGAPPRARTTSAARPPCAPTSAGCCPCSSSTATRATTCVACRTARRAELDTWVEANAAAVRALLPADVVFTNHVLLGGPVGAATGAPFAVKAHGSELEYSMRGQPRALGLGRRVARARARRRSSAPSTSAPSSPRSAATTESVHRGPARGRHRRMGAGAARGRARRAARGGAPRPAEPGQHRGAPARRRQRRPARALPRDRASPSSSTSAS